MLRLDEFNFSFEDIKNSFDIAVQLRRTLLSIGTAQCTNNYSSGSYFHRYLKEIFLNYLFSLVVSNSHLASLKG